MYSRRLNLSAVKFLVRHIYKLGLYELPKVHQTSTDSWWAHSKCCQLGRKGCALVRDLAQQEGARQEPGLQCFGQFLVLLDSVDLPSSFLYRYPHELSGGQKQRVCVARAIALNPSLLILDEPTSALDVSVQAQVLNLLKDLQEIFNFTLVMVTHDLPVVSFMCDELIVMKNGRIVEAGTTDNVVRRPLQDYTKLLIDSVI